MARLRALFELPFDRAAAGLFRYQPTLRDWMVDACRGSHDDGDRFSVDIRLMTDGRLVSPDLESISKWQLVAVCVDGSVIVYDDGRAWLLDIVSGRTSEFFRMSCLTKLATTCATKDWLYWFEPSLTKNTRLIRANLTQRTRTQLASSTQSKSHLLVDPLDATLLWALVDRVYNDYRVVDEPLYYGELTAFSVPLGVDVGAVRKRLVLCTHIVATATGEFLVIANEQNPSRQDLLCIDRLAEPSNQIRVLITDLPNAVTFVDPQMVGVDRGARLALDRRYKRLMILYGPRKAFAVDGLPLHWFAHPSLLHNWRKLAVLIAFLRANQDHPFRFSVLALLNSPLILGLVPTS